MDHIHDTHITLQKNNSLDYNRFHIILTAKIEEKKYLLVINLEKKKKKIYKYGDFIDQLGLKMQNKKS